MKFSALSIFIIFATVLASGCAHKSNAPSPSGDATVTAPAAAPAVASTAEYEGHCAMGVCTGKFADKGNPDIKLERDGKTYYFCTEDDKAKFEKKLNANVKKADRRWRAFLHRGGSHAL